MTEEDREEFMKLVTGKAIVWGDNDGYFIPNGDREDDAIFGTDYDNDGTVESLDVRWWIEEGLGAGYWRFVESVNNKIKLDVEEYLNELLYAFLI